MISEKFRTILNEMFPSFDRTVNIIDRDLNIIASNDTSKLGEKASISNFEKLSSSDFVVDNGITYKYFGNKKSDEFAISVSGADDQSKIYANILAVSFSQITDYYMQKNSKIDFIRDLIFENVLPGEVKFKTKELKLDDSSHRVCFIVQSENNVDIVDFLPSLREMFPDQTKDFVIGIDSKTIVVIKDTDTSTSDQSLEALAGAIVSVLSSKYFVRICVGVGSIAKTLDELPNSFKHAQVALAVRKVFENDKSVALYSSLGIARLIYQLPVTLCEVFLDEVFKKCKIDALDRDLMFTISKFFENSLNISETARRLFVHRNTLVYRIDKIRKLTGLDLRNFEDAIVFKVALMVNKYLKGSLNN